MRVKDPIVTSLRLALDTIEKRLGKMQELLDALADRKFRKIVTVVPGTLGKRCRAVRGCRRKPKFMLFGDDGKPRMSRLAVITCAHHLSKAVEKLHAEQVRKGGQK